MPFCELLSSHQLPILELRCGALRRTSILGWEVVPMLIVFWCLGFIIWARLTFITDRVFKAICSSLFC